MSHNSMSLHGLLQEFKHCAMKAYGRVDVHIHIFLTSVLDGGEWSASPPSRCTPRERASGTHWVDPRAAGLDDVEFVLILSNFLSTKPS
jgi:hypothetical protein